MSALIDSYAESNQSSQLPLNSGGNTKVGQSFYGSGYPINSAKFFIKKIGTPSGDMVATLYAHTGTYGNGGTPTGNALATSTVINANTLTDSFQLIEFTFPTPYTAVAGTPYFIIIQYSGGDGSNYVAVGFDNTAPTHSGNLSIYTGSWTAYATDLIFYCYTSSSPVAIRAVGTPVVAGTGAVTPTIPAGVQVGDLMVAIAYHYSDSLTFTCSAGWDERYDPGSQTNGSWAVYTRVYQAGDGNPTITPSGNESIIAVILVLYNCDISTIFDVAIAGAAFSAPGSPYDVTITGFNTVTNGALAFYCWGSKDDNLWVYQSGGGTQQVSQDNIAGADNSICIETESLPTAGATGNQVSRQTAKAGDAGRKLWFAIKPAATGNSYSESLTLASGAGFSDSRIASIALTASLPSAAAISESNVWNGFIALALAAAAGISESAAWDGFRATTLAGGAALSPTGGLDLERSVNLPGAAAITGAANLAILRELGLVCQANFGLASVLSASPMMSLASSAGLAETRITDLLGSAGLPGTAAISEQTILAALNALGLSVEAGISEARLLEIFKAISLPGSAVTLEQALLAALESLGLSVTTGISEAALLEALNGTNLSGSGALELLSALIAQGALVLSGNAGLGADGVVEGEPGQNYYESLGLPSLAAIVKSALLEMLASSALPGAAHISVAGLMQATTVALLSASGALTPGHILDRLAAAQFSAAAGVSLGTFLQALNGVLLSTSGSISPAAVNAALNLLALAVTADLDELVQIALTKTLDLTGAAAQQVVIEIGRSGSIFLPAQGQLATAAELEIMRTCSLAGIASLEAGKQISCAGFLALQSISALVPYFGPGIKRGYRLELILDELELDLKLN